MFSRNVLAIALLATTALAQIPGLPDCAQNCVTDYGGCNQVDVKCICSNKPLLTKLSCCVSKNCDAQGQAAVISFADSLCSGEGVNNLPTKATCAPGSESTGTAAASGSSGTMSMTSAPSSTGTGSTAASQTETSSAATSSAAAATQSEGVAGKTYPVERVGLGMAVLGFLAAL